MLSQSEILQYLRDNREMIGTRFGIRRIGLFGSFARNEQTENSDVDILIDMQDGVDDLFGKRLSLSAFLERRFERHVDVCYEKALRPVFRDMVRKEVIYA